ncbi:acetylxylan esterase precursor, partial [Apiospora arundinis]
HTSCIPIKRSNIMDAEDSVFLGVWTNWSRGSVFGSTLTLSREHGNYVIALTAFYIAFVATRFWRISCFIFHRCFSSPIFVGTMHRQRQIILCNSKSPESGFVSLLILLWSWRHLGLKHLYGLSFLAIFATLCVSGFVVAGSFSSRISTDMGNEVLLRANHCGFVRSPNTSASSIWYSLLSQQISTAMNYAEECYSSSRVSSMVECKGFIVPKLPTAITKYNASCPFQNNICRSKNSNIMLDSGYIDSREHLGLNSPNSQQFQQREVLHCAPLETERYERTFSLSNKTFVAYDYGGIIEGTINNITVANYKYQIEDIDSQYRTNPLKHSESDFKIRSEFSWTYQNKPRMTGTFIPRKELQRPDGDIEIIFLSGNGVAFDRRMADDWYRATVPFHNLTRTTTSDILQGYIFETAASPLGCVRQWQWCNPSLPKDQACGPLASYSDSYTAAAHLFGITDKEMEGFRESSRSPVGSALIWGHLISNHHPFLLYQFLSASRSSFLSSEDRLYGAAMTGLPDDQWKQDVIKWWNTILATRQLSYIYTVRGPSEPEFDAMRLNAVNDYENTFCESQKVLSTAHTSFSMFGLCFKFVTGGLIVILSYLLDPIFSCLHTRYHHKSYQHLEWVANATLQIHRQAEEQIGFSKWRNCTSTIPISQPDDVLSSLDITDPKHPKLRRPANTASGLPLDDLCEDIQGQKVECNLTNSELTNDDNTVSVSDVLATGALTDLGQGTPTRPGNKVNVSSSHSEVCSAMDPY